MAPTCVAGPRDVHDETALAAPSLPCGRSMTTTASVEIGERKRALRHELRSRRALLPEATRRREQPRGRTGGPARAALAAADHGGTVLAAGRRDRHLTVAACPALAGRQPLLPRMHGKGRPLTFHAWQPELELTHGPFQVREPPAGLPAMHARAGAGTAARVRSGAARRLGYGAGFYDMTFAALAAAGGSPRRVGFCFACQEIDSVPADATDIALDLVITETGPREIA